MDSSVNLINVPANSVGVFSPLYLWPALVHETSAQEEAENWDNKNQMVPAAQKNKTNN